MARKPRRKGDAVLVEALARGQTASQAARMAGVSVRTAFRRLEDPVFQDDVRKCRSRIVDGASGALAATMKRATRTLRGLLDDNHPTVRLGAARAVLEVSQRLHETVQIEQRLAELEEAVKGAKE